MKILSIFLFFFLFYGGIYGKEINTIRLLHSNINSVEGDEPIVISSNAIDAYLINYMILHYKKKGDSNWSEIEMLPAEGKYIAVIPQYEVDRAKKGEILYYIEVVDIKGRSKNGFASPEKPQHIKIKNKSYNKKRKKTDKEVIDELQIFIENDYSAKKVTLASGKEESIIGTPFSVTVITQKEIETSGATSIQEIFRLVPGMIVREQTAGNYDVHIRGFDNVPPDGFSTIASDMLTLLMINNRVVYDYQLGGVFWDALPIDINDIERIEIVRGPASAMYGPSAASGVINIITKKVSSKNRYIGWVNVAKGNKDSTFLQGIAGYYQDIKGERRLGIVVSGNFQNRGRFSKAIWSWTQDPNNPGVGEYVEDPEDIRSVNSNYQNLPKDLFVDVQYPYPNTGVKRRGFNINVTYDFNKNLNLQVDAGAQESVSLKPWMETLDSFLLTHESNTQYINTKLKLWDLNTRVSYTWGKQPIRGQIAMSNNINILNSSIDYNIKLLDIFDIKTMINYNNIQYGSIGYGGGVYKTAKIENLGLSLRTETSFLKNKALKFVAAGRLDMFAHLDDQYFTFQFASVYNFKNRFVVRGVYSRANRNPFLGPTFYQIRNLDENNPTIYMGNKDIDLVTVDLIEFGSRFKLNHIFDIDLELFYTTAKDFSHFVPSGNIVVIEGISRLEVLWSQLNLKAKQYGATITTNINFKKIKTKLFLTFQKTELENYNRDWFDDQVANLGEKGETIEHKDTPTFFGGGYINIGPFYKFNININSYFYSEQTYHHLYDSFKISSKIILSGKVTYDITDRATIYFNARNFLNDSSREFGFADKTGGLYIVGFTTNF